MAAEHGDGGGDFDEVLVRAKAGEDAAWVRLLDGLAAPVVGYLRTRGAPDPEDVASEAFLRVARSIGSFEGDERGFRSWVFTIAHRQLLDDHRRRARRPATEPLADGDLDRRAEHDGVELGAPAVVTAGPTARGERVWTDEATIELVARLTPDQRDVVLLRVVGGFSIEEVAAIVGKPAGSVKQLQHRGLAALRRWLEQQPEG